MATPFPSVARATKIPQVLTGLNVSFDGVGHLGTSKTVTLPKLNFETKDQEFGGMTRSVDLGVLQKMECEITLEEYTNTVYKAITYRGGSDFVVILKGDILQGGKHIGAEIMLKGLITELDDGDFETKKEIERKISMAVNFYSLDMNGEKKITIDTDNLICEIDGVDLLEQTRNNLSV